MECGSNHIVGIVSWSEFARNFAKFNIVRTICALDKDWSNFTNGQYGPNSIVPN